MSNKKQKLQRFLTENMHIIDLVLEIYSPENYKILTIESFKLNLEDMLKDIDEIVQELPPEYTLLEILE